MESVKEFLKRRVTLPVWALLVIGLVAFGLGLAGEEDEGSEVAATNVTATTFPPLRAAAPSTTTTTEATTTTTAPTTTTTEAPKRWVQVASAAGTSEKRTPLFRLTGAEARLRYNFKGEGNFGVFGVYVMEAGDSLEKSGGFPEVTCSQGSCNDETRLVKDAGEYYLEVKSVNGSWNIIVEELR